MLEICICCHLTQRIPIIYLDKFIFFSIRICISFDPRGCQWGDFWVKKAIFVNLSILPELSVPQQRSALHSGRFGCNNHHKGLLQEERCRETTALCEGGNVFCMAGPGWTQNWLIKVEKPQCQKEAGLTQVMGNSVIFQLSILDALQPWKFIAIIWLKFQTT